MLITLYTPVGIEYQKFTINDDDIIYGDLIKYINLPKHELYNELDESNKIFDKVFIKTIINLFSYNQINIKEINLDEEINGNNKFTILFSYKYYIYDYYYDYDYYCNNGNFYYKKIENNIKNYNNIIKNVIKNDPLQIIFVNYDNENYDEICKLSVQNNGYLLQCIKPEFRSDEICKLAVQQNGYALEYVKEQTDEICKLAVQQNGLSLQNINSE